MLATIRNENTTSKRLDILSSSFKEYEKLGESDNLPGFASARADLFAFRQNQRHNTGKYYMRVAITVKPLQSF
jgi:hypothetical protein